MRAVLGEEPDSHLICPHITQLQCSPLRDRKRFRCTYAKEGGGTDTVVVERRAEGSWHWIKGKGCSVLY